MKRNTFRLVAVILVLSMASAVAVGCKDGSGDTEHGSGDAMERATVGTAGLETVYVPETIPLPDSIGQVFGNNIAISADKVYFAAMTDTYDEDTVSYGYYNQLYSMNFDGTDFSELQNYIPPKAPRSDASGGSFISSISADSDGNLWVLEQWSFGGYDLPDGFDAEHDNPENYDYIEYDSGHALRKLDRMGAELLSVDISGISGNRADFYIQSLSTDGAGNIYMAVMDHSGGSIIYVLDDSGKTLFQLNTSRVERLIQMPDGTVAFMDNSGSSGQMVRTIDIDAKAFGNPISIPGIGQLASIYPGNGEFDLLVSDSEYLYGFTVGADEPVRLLSWLDTGLLADGMEHIILLPDSRIMCLNNAYNMRTNEFKTELLLLTAKPYSELPEKTEKTVLTLATLNTYFIRDLVVEFNRTNPDNHIEVIDYSEGVDWSAGLARLSTEIISGKVPDILDVTHLPYMQYASKGLLADLYPLIDSDPEISRDDILEGVFRAAEIDGGLYMAFPSFGVRVIVGHPSVIGTSPDWTLDEFKAVIEAHPDADLPLGGGVTKRSFLQSAISMNIDEYIDWKNGTVNFDADSFISLLESANMLPAQYDDSLHPEELFPSGRQIMAYEQFFQIFDFQRFKSLFGGEIAHKGFPSKNNSGITMTPITQLAIAADSKNQDGAWAFIRSLFDEGRQLGANDFGFPTNKAVFDAMLEKAIEDSKIAGDDNVITISSSDGKLHYEIPLQPITGEDAVLLKSMIDAAAGAASSYGYTGSELWDIISEGASDYFNGVSSAEEAARVIQSRASIYVSEQS